MIERTYAFGSVSPAVESDIPVLARDMREMDVLEIKKFGGIGPEEALRISLQGAKMAYCLRDNSGTPVSILWRPPPRSSRRVWHAMESPCRVPGPANDAICGWIC